MRKPTFSIAKDFSPFAGPRKRAQGSHSGEALRAKLLRFLQTNPGEVLIDLDGTRGMGSSYLDEAFGGLVRYEGQSKSELNARLRYQSQLDPSYISTIRDSIERAEPAH